MEAETSCLHRDLLLVKVVLANPCYLLGRLPCCHGRPPGQHPGQHPAARTLKVFEGSGGDVSGVVAGVLGSLGYLKVG